MIDPAFYRLFVGITIGFLMVGVMRKYGLVPKPEDRVKAIGLMLALLMAGALLSEIGAG